MQVLRTRFLNFEITYFAFFLKLYTSRWSVFPPFLPLFFFHLLNVFREKITERHHLANQLMKSIMFFLLLCGRFLYQFRLQGTHALWRASGWTPRIENSSKTDVARKILCIPGKKIEKALWLELQRVWSKNWVKRIFFTEVLYFPVAQYIYRTWCQFQL